MNPRWFFSRTVRHATDLRKQVRIELNSQRDILAPKALAEVSRELDEFNQELQSARDDRLLLAAMGKLEKTATQWLKPYPHPEARENCKEFLVSGVLVLAIFAFFAQPMKIPSGSAQPTLYGNVVKNLRDNPDGDLPPFATRVLDWFRGIDYYLWIAKEDGTLTVGAPVTNLGFIRRQQFALGSDSYTIWWPPERFEMHARLHHGQKFRKGEIILKARVSSGDRLFVDRMTYNFRRPVRGETIVFNSTGLPHPSIIQNTHYIKRLVGLSGDRVQIGNDRHLIINGQRLDAATPHFENVYSFTGPPRDSVYSGHVNRAVAAQHGNPNLAELFPDEQAVFPVGPNRYLAMGDNTMNSNDGRTWGDFPREKVIGRAFFVFWPLTERFGLALW